MASASDFNRYRTNGAAYVRHTLNTIHHHGTGAGAKIWALLLAFPAAVQGVYYLLTGLWPQVSIRSFMAVTGPKTDVWLVHTVGWLVLVIGVALCVAAYRRQQSAEVLIVGIGSAVALAVVDVYFVLENQISAVYLLDAALEVALIFLWICALYNEMGASKPAQRPAAAANQVPVAPQPAVPMVPQQPAVPPAPTP